MDLLTFLNQPIVVTSLTLLVGSYILSVLSERRSRQDKLREKAIEFITEIGDNMNQVYSRLFGHIRSKRPDVWQDQNLREAQGDLFAKRMSVKVKSQVYLESGDFWKKYDDIIWEFNYIMTVLSKLEEEHDIEKIVAIIQNYRVKLAGRWPIANEDETRDLVRLDAPYGELSAWTHMVVARIDSLLAKSLKDVFK